MCLFCLRFVSDSVDHTQDLKEDCNEAAFQDSQEVFTETGVCVCVLQYFLRFDHEPNELFATLHSVVSKNFACLYLTFIYIIIFFAPPDVTLPSCLDGSPGSPETQMDGRFQRACRRPMSCQSPSSVFANMFQEMLAIYAQLKVRTTEMMTSCLMLIM